MYSVMIGRVKQKGASHIYDGVVVDETGKTLSYSY